MEENDFYREVYAACEQYEGQSFGAHILYDMCDGAKYPWGDVKRLADKILIIGRVHNASPQIKLNNCNGELFFTALAEFIVNHAAYVPLIEKLKNVREYAYDMSKEDLTAMKTVFDTVRSFHSLVQEGVSALDVSYNGQDERLSERRIQIRFCSNFLHYHFPQKIVGYHNDTVNRAIVLFSEDKCCFRSVEADESVQSALSSDYRELLSMMRDMNFLGDNREQFFVIRYFHHFVKSYVLCRFLKNHCGAVGEQPIDFMSVVNNVFNDITKV